MDKFGVFPNYESRVFSIPVQPNAVPVRLMAAAPGSIEREFLLVPQPELTREFSSLSEFKFSAVLQSRFEYLGGASLELGLGRPAGRGASEKRHLRFAIVRWGKKSRAPFPTTLHMLQYIPSASGLVDGDLIEIVSTPADAVDAQTEIAV